MYINYCVSLLSLVNRTTATKDKNGDTYNSIETYNMMFCCDDG